MIAYASRDGRRCLFVADARRLGFLPAASAGVIFTSPPYWIQARGQGSAESWARALALDFGRQWERVLMPGGDLWLVIGDHHDGREWVSLDGLLTGWLRRRGWRLQAKGLWAQTRSRERWDHRLNYLLRFRRPGPPVRPGGTTLAWMLPLPRSHAESLWDATPAPLVVTALQASRRRGAVLDPFAGAGTVGLVAATLGRPFIGVERDPHMAALCARRLGLRRVPSARVPGLTPGLQAIRELTPARRPPGAPGPAGAGSPGRRPAPRGREAVPRS